MGGGGVRWAARGEARAVGGVVAPRVPWSVVLELYHVYAK